MASSGVNIEQIRNLNKIRVYGVFPRNPETHEEGGTKRIFEAYMTSPIGQLKAGADVNSLTQQIGNFFKGLGFVGDIAKSGLGTFLTDQKNAGLLNTIGTATDLANELNYPFHYRYNGTSVFTTTLQCELVVKDDFIDDVVKPLWRLIRYVMPSETQTTGSTSIYKDAEDKVKGFYDFIKNSISDFEKKYINSDLLQKIGRAVDEGIGRVGDTANDILSDISVMKKPPQLTDYSHTRILIGNYIVIDDVIISDVNFNIPYLLYEGGLFDKVTVTLTLKGTRKMSIKTYDWLKELMWNYENGYRINPVTERTLNSQYK